MKIHPSLVLLSSLLVAAGCGSSKLISKSLNVPRGDLASVKAESGSVADRRIAQAQRWIAKAPKLPKGYSALGQALMQKGRETGDLQNYNDALAAFEKAVELMPDDSETLHNLAWCWTMFHRFPKAIGLAKRALKADATDPFAYGVLTDSYMELGRYSEALDAAQRMVDLRPDLASYSRAAQVQWASGNAKGAMFTMAKAARAGGAYAENTAWCETQLGDMYWKTGAVKAAEQAYRRVLSRLPSYRHALFGVARVEAAGGKWDAALAHYEKAAAGNPPIPYVVEYGEALEKTGYRREAENQFSRVERLVQAHLEHGIEGDELALAEYYLSRGVKLDEALRLCKSEISEHIALGNFSALGWAHHLAGQEKEAWKALEKGLSLGGKDARLLARASAVRRAMGKKDEAERLMAAARSLNPNFDLTQSFEKVVAVAQR